MTPSNGKGKSGYVVQRTEWRLSTIFEDDFRAQSQPFEQELASEFRSVSPNELIEHCNS
jgi:hypothetical protein